MAERGRWAWAGFAAGVAAWALEALLVAYGVARVESSLLRAEAWASGAVAVGPWGGVRYSEGLEPAAMLLLVSGLVALVAYPISASWGPWWAGPLSLMAEAAALSALSAAVYRYLHLAVWAAEAAAPGRLWVGSGYLVLPGGGAASVEWGVPPALLAVPPALAVAGVGLAGLSAAEAGQGGAGGRLLGALPAVAAALAVLALVGVTVYSYRSPVQAPSLEPPEAAGARVAGNGVLVIPKELAGGRVGRPHCTIIPLGLNCTIIDAGASYVVKAPGVLWANATLTGWRGNVYMQVEAPVDLHGVEARYEARVPVAVYPVRPVWRLSLQNGTLTFDPQGYPPEAIENLTIHWLRVTEDGHIIVEGVTSTPVEGPLSVKARTDTARVYVNYVYAGKHYTYSTIIREGEVYTVTPPVPPPA